MTTAFAALAPYTLITLIKPPVGLPFLLAALIQYIWPIPIPRDIVSSWKERGLDAAIHIVTWTAGWWAVNTLVHGLWFREWIGVIGLYPTFRMNESLSPLLLAYVPAVFIGNYRILIRPYPRSDPRASLRWGVIGTFTLLFAWTGIPNVYALAPLALLLGPSEALFVSTVGVCSAAVEGWWGPWTAWAMLFATSCALVPRNVPITDALDRVLQRPYVAVAAAMALWPRPLFSLPAYTDFTANVVHCSGLGQRLYDTTAWASVETGSGSSLMFCTYAPVVYLPWQPLVGMSTLTLIVIGKLLSFAALGVLYRRSGVAPLLFLPVLVGARLDNPTLWLTAALAYCLPAALRRAP